MHGRPLGSAADLGEEILRQGETFQRSARFEEAVKLVGDIAELDHLSHAENIYTCVAHVKSREHVYWVVYGFLWLVARYETQV
jgi:hypothetical protein